MTVTFLVVTPHLSFGEMIRQSLEEAGEYRVHVTRSKADAAVKAHDEVCSLAFLDVDLGETTVAECGLALREINPEINLVVICGEANPPALDAIRPWTLLRKPFYVPHLLSMLGITPPQQATPSASQEHDLAWLQDVNKAARHLTQLTLESAAQAALLTREDQLWAYAGQLPQNAASELAEIITRHWDSRKGSDLLRFVHLEATRAEHMLYATSLTETVTLALVFDAETPFSTIRAQASRLANSLALPGTEEDQAAQLPDEQGEELEMPSITGILAEIPPPNPQARDESLPTDTRPSTPLPHAAAYSRETSPAIPIRGLFISEQAARQELEETVPHMAEDLDVTAPAKPRRARTPVPPGELDETRPHSITEVAGRVVLEPVAPGLYNLTYACLLVPRFTSHHLTGDVADRLSIWLPQITVAFGWRLEFLAVRPDYLQWVVNVAPSTSPGYLMRIIRQQTSEKIFSEFPGLKKENPSGDFWAPGYLIMGSNQPHPAQLVRDYIRQTRERQGISRPRK